MSTMLLSSEEAELYSGLKGGMIVLWDLSTSKTKLNLQGHSTVITAMSIFRSNSPLILASASSDGKIKLWDFKSKSPVVSIKAHFSQIDCLSFSRDFDYLASGAQDGTMKIWDIRQTNKIIRELNSNDKKAINCIEFNSDAKMLAFGSKDKTVKIYDYENFSKIAQTTFDRLPIEQIHFDKKGDGFFIATNEALKYWKIENEKQLKPVDMFETGWSKLQSFRVIEGKAVYGLSSFGNKLSYYQIPYDQLFKDFKKHRAVPYMPDITEDMRESNDSTFFRNESFQQRINNINIGPSEERTATTTNNVLPPDLDNFITNSVNNYSNVYEPVGISRFMGNISNMSISMTKDEQSILGMSKNESIFVKNAMNMMNSSNTLFNKEQNINKRQLQQDDININKNILDTPPQIINKPSSGKPKSIIAEVNSKEINDDSLDNGNSALNKENNNNGNNTNTPILHTQKDDNEIPVDTNAFNSNVPPVESVNTKDPPNFLNLESKTDISVIHQSNHGVVEESFLEEPFFLLDNMSNRTNQKDMQSTNSSFMSYRSNAPMGIDLNQFIKASTSMNDTVHPISQAHDLGIIEEINTAHSEVRKQISKRFNNIKAIYSHWEQSNIDSTLYGLKTTKDLSAANDFFNYAILSRKDISKIPFTLEHYLTMLKLLRKQFDTKYEPYIKTGCKIGGKMIELLNDKVSIIKKGSSVFPLNMQSEEDKVHKCDMIIEEFRGIFNRVKQIVRKANKQETKDLMNTFIMEMEFFLKPYSTDGPEIKIANGN